jgi:hypothetical protein
VITKRSFFYVDSATGDHFTGPLVDNASEFEVFTISAPHGRVPITIGSIRIISAENLDWDVVFFTSAAPGSAASLASAFRVIGRWPFVAADAERMVGQGYVYDVDGLLIPYADEQSLGRITVAIYNRNATAKTAGAAGFLHLRLGCYSEAAG